MIDTNEKISQGVADLENSINTQTALKMKFDKINIQYYNKYIIQDKKTWEFVLNREFDKKSEMEIVDILKVKYKLYTRNPEDDSLLYTYYVQQYGRWVIGKDDDEDTINQKMHDRSHRSYTRHLATYNETIGIRNSFEDLTRQAQVQRSSFIDITMKMLSFLDSLNFIKRIIYSLIVAFFALIIYPLHFMPQFTEVDPEVTLGLNVIWQNLWSLKGALLSLFTIVIAVIIVIFFINLHNMKDLIGDTTYRCELHRPLKNYSDYLNQSNN